MWGFHLPELERNSCCRLHNKICIEPEIENIGISKCILAKKIMLNVTESYFFVQKDVLRI